MATERSKLILSLALKDKHEGMCLQERPTYREKTRSPINTNYVTVEADESDSDYVLHDLQPVKLLSKTEAIGEGFVKLNGPCTISNQKVINWLQTSHFTEEMEVNGNQYSEDCGTDEVDILQQTSFIKTSEQSNHDEHNRQTLASIQEESTVCGSEDIPLIHLQNRPHVSTSTIVVAKPIGSDVSYTKKETIRKRRKFEIDVKTKKLLKLEKIAADHKVLSGCKNNCKKKCRSTISEQQRAAINKEFWKLSNKERKAYLLNTCQGLQVKRRTGESKRKNNTFKYFLKTETGENVEVCKTFLLTTLGYKKSNDRVLHDTLSRTPKGSLAALPHGLIGKSSNRKINDEDINNHIESFSPCVSHYRRAHAPNVRYLSSDITVSLMYKDFQEKYPTIKVSYETYRKKIKEKRISFTKLGHEECDMCETFKLHGQTESSFDDSCSTCITWKSHIERAKASRRLYGEHANCSFDEGTVCVSADLQKVVMLPRMDMFKTVIFLKRLVAYNETFPVGSIFRVNKPYAVVWHEAISKRSKEDLISTFYAFFKWQRDASNIIVLLDNCASQNKNWALLTFLVRMVNSDEISAKRITFNYFEPGHTFMSADSFHHQVELSMKRRKKIYDYNDFADAVGSACKGNVHVKKMEPCDFYNWPNWTSSAKLKADNRPYLSDIVQIIAERGQYTLKYRTNFTEEAAKNLDFLMKRVMKKSQILKNIPCINKPRGFAKTKKEAILKELATLLPENRKVFWRNLPVLNEDSADDEENGETAGNM